MKFLNIRALTWTRDSHGLFDYETFQLLKNTIKTNTNCVLARYGAEVKVLEKEQSELINKIGTIRIRDGIICLYT